MSMITADYGRNDILVSADGRKFIDLISSTGAVFLGHANHAVNQHIKDQLDRLSCSWTSATTIESECREEVSAHIDDGLSLYGLYSSGMEAAEVGMRIATDITGRTGIVGFQTNNHGKSIATQNITGSGSGLPDIPSLHALRFPTAEIEDDVLRDFEALAAEGSIAAVLIEAMQGKGGGHTASVEFYRRLSELCRAFQIVVVCDEIFTGFYRTGTCFYYPRLGLDPDIVLVGKALANGFPASGVLLRNGFDYHPKDFRYTSTFSNNPVACAAVIGSLREMTRIEVQARVARIEGAFAEFNSSVAMRLAGACCFIDVNSPESANAVREQLFDDQILILQRGATLGFWPPATITDGNLERVVERTSAALERYA